MCRRAVVIVSASLVAFVIAGLSNIVTAAGTEQETPPAVQLVGQNSKIAEPRFVLIRDEQAWAKLWFDHTGVEINGGPPVRNAAPIIDFNRYMVVGYFRGKCVNHDGEIASSVVVSEDELRVRFEASTFQTMSSDPGKPDTGAKATPYGLWVVSRTDNAIVVEEGRRGLKNDPVTWKEVHRFGKQ